MAACICVGAGGFVGAVLRYLLSSVFYHESFPLATFIINFIGSFVIGVVIELSSHFSGSPNLVLFFKTGVCGGFTTFSTFSSEVLSLFEKKQYLMGGGYACGSVIVCVLGVWLGKMIVNLFVR